MSIIKRACLHWETALHGGTQRWTSPEVNGAVGCLAGTSSPENVGETLQCNRTVTCFIKFAKLTHSGSDWLRLLTLSTPASRIMSS